MNENSKLNEILEKANKVEINNLINNKKQLFEITYYSVDESGIYPETSWIVECESSDKAMERCSELSNKFKGGVFMCKPVTTMAFEEFNDEFIVSELEML